MTIELKHDPEADAAYFTLSEGEIADSEESSPGIVWDFDKNNQVVGVEILNFKYRTPDEFINMAEASESYLTEEQKIAFRDFFSKTPLPV